MAAMVSGFFELFMRVLAVLTLPHWLGEVGIFYAEPLAWIGAVIVLAPCCYRRIRDLRSSTRKKSPRPRKTRKNSPKICDFPLDFLGEDGILKIKLRIILILKRRYAFMELKGSKTEKNLMAAFAGESEARNKYTYYASKAKKDGYVQIAQLFEETAANEKEHAKIWFKILHGGAVGGTAETCRTQRPGKIMNGRICTPLLLKKRGKKGSIRSRPV